MIHTLFLVNNVALGFFNFKLSLILALIYGILSILKLRFAGERISSLQIFLSFISLCAILSKIPNGKIEFPLLLTLIVADFVTLWTILYQIHYPPDSKQFVASMIKNVFRNAFLISLIIFGALLFFPKLSYRYLSNTTQKSVMGFGSGSEMNPGEISELQQSHEISFRVKTNSIHAVQSEKILYWRGSALSKTTDGLHWYEGIDQNEIFKSADPLEEIQQEILLEPRFDQTLFALDFPVGTPSLKMTAHTKLFEETLYRARSALYPAPAELTEDEKQHLLRPPFRIDRETLSLVKEWKKKNSSFESFSQTVYSYFHENLRARLNPGTYGSDSLNSFLFHRREGFCEHFAGAFATLMRLAGYPSRIVLGFRGGEWNPWSMSYTLRDSDAHAWVESWNNGHWIRFDPTLAAQGGTPPDQNPQPISLFIEATLTKFGYFYHQPENRIFVKTLFALLGLLFIVFQFRKNLFQKNSHSKIELRLYHQYCRRLEKMGVIRGQNEGPTKYLKRVLEAFPHLNQKTKENLSEFFKLFCELHYRDESVDLQKLKRMKTLFNTFQI